MKPNYFNIPTPCSEDWNKMTGTEQGAFCAKCTKEVLDCSSLKSTEIKELLAAKKEPCVRIFGYQIDEMNFFEWLNSLTLRKQFSYKFLFAFILVFKMGASVLAQDTTIIQPQFIEIEPQDLITTKELLAEIKLEEDLFIPLLKFDHDPLIYNVVCTESLGFTQIYGDWTSMPIPKEEITEKIPYAPYNPYEIPAPLEKYGLIAINDLKMTAFIEGDTLIFSSNSAVSEQITVKIKKNNQFNWLLSQTIVLPAGQHNFRIPLHELANGNYQIMIENKGTIKAVEIVYW